MKIKRFSLYAVIGVFITGLTILLILSRSDQSVIAQHNDPHQIFVSGSYSTASISKGTILLLLAVGIIGVLGVSRKKKGSGSHIQNNEIHDVKKHCDRT